MKQHDDIYKMKMIGAALLLNKERFMQPMMTLGVIERIYDNEPLDIFGNFSDLEDDTELTPPSIPRPWGYEPPKEQDEWEDIPKESKEALNDKPF